MPSASSALWALMHRGTPHSNCSKLKVRYLQSHSTKCRFARVRHCYGEASEAIPGRSGFGLWG